MVDVCPDIDAEFKEMLILLNGNIIAFFKDGKKEFLTVLEDGEYLSTDSRKCKFEIFEGELL